MMANKYLSTVLVAMFLGLWFVQSKMETLPDGTYALIFAEKKASVISMIKILPDGTYTVVAAGDKMRVLENKEGKLVILRGREAKELPEGGAFTQTTTRESKTTVTRTK